MAIYATAADLIRWAGDGTPEPKNADQLLRTASALVRKATRRARYSVDSAGLPADAVIRAAFSDATAIQAAFWAVQGIDPDHGAAGMVPVVASTSISGASVSYMLPDAALEARVNMGYTLCASAMAVLSDANLISARVGGY